MSKGFDLIVFRKYRSNGKNHYKPYIVGEAFQSKKTKEYILDIPRNISISGRVILSPKSDSTRNNHDLINLYNSTADEFDL